MSNERLAIGQELALEVRRLADEPDPYGQLPGVFDFGDSATVAYRDMPWGLLAVEYHSEYMELHGNLIHVPDDENQENSEIANIVVEARYRTVRATGDILCDWERYDIHADGSIETTVSKGELTNASRIDEDILDDEDEDFDSYEDLSDEDESLKDKSDVVFGIEGFSAAALTPQQAWNDRLLDRLSEKLRTVAPEERAGIADRIDRFQASGEQAIYTRLDASTEDLRELLDRLKSLGTADKLGQIMLISIVDESDIDE